MRWTLTLIEFLEHAKLRAATESRPFVTLSYAQSVDGSIARRRGEPFPISGAEALVLTHQLRAWHAGILIGRGTVMADDPSLTVRLVDGPQPQPVVLDSGLQSPLTSKLFQHPKAPWFVCCAGAENPALAAKAGAVLALEPDDTGRVSLPAVLRELRQRGIDSLMVEGGAEVLTAFLLQGLVDVVVVTVAPLFLGGLRGYEFSDGHPVRLTEIAWTQAGQDMVLWGRVA